MSFLLRIWGHRYLYLIQEYVGSVAGVPSRTWPNTRNRSTGGFCSIPPPETSRPGGRQNPICLAGRPRLSSGQGGGLTPGPVKLVISGKSGRSAVRLAHQHGGLGVGGSNPLAPTFSYEPHAFPPLDGPWPRRPPGHRLQHP